jgi:hypothetical protein
MNSKQTNNTWIIENEKIINHTVNLHFFFPIHLHKIPRVETTPKIKGNEKI